MLTDACQGSEWRRGDWQARVLECTVTPIVLGFIQHPKPGPSILKGGAYGSHLISRAVWQRRVFFAPCLLQTLPERFLPLLHPLPTRKALSRAHPTLSLIAFMSSPPNPPPPNAFDNMRLPAYRASYLGRYHPYPRTRAPAREVVMVRALPLDYPP